MPRNHAGIVNAVTAPIALAGGLCLGVLDLQTSDVVMTLGAMFVFNMVLGAAAPRGGWYWPVLSTVGILIMNWFPGIVRLESNPYLTRSFFSYLLLAAILIIAGLGGMLFGVIVRRSLHASPVE